MLFRFELNTIVSGFACQTIFELDTHLRLVDMLHVSVIVILALRYYIILCELPLGGVASRYASSLY